MDKELLREFEKKAKTDGQFAIAYAVLAFAQVFDKYRQFMTFGPEDTKTGYPGIGEKIGMELADLQQGVASLAAAVQQIADKDD